MPNFEWKTTLRKKKPRVNPEITNNVSFSRGNCPSGLPLYKLCSFNRYTIYQNFGSQYCFWAKSSSKRIFKQKLSLANDNAIVRPQCSSLLGTLFGLNEDVALRRVQFSRSFILNKVYISLFSFLCGLSIGTL